MAIERDYQGVVTLRVRNRRTREVQGWSLQDWHVQLSIAHVVRSTEAMAAMAEAEVRILYELALPAWIRVPTELAWIGLMCHVHRQELENLVEQISDLNPALDWLHQNAPTSVQVFLVRLATVRVGRATPEAMNPVEIGREIGRALRNLRSIMHLIISITRLARGSVTAGVGASVRAFTGAGALATERSLANLSQTIRDFAGLRALRNLRNVPAGVEALAQREAVGLVADWARSQGLTLDNQTIDQLIRENTNEETGERLVQVLATLRNFMDLSNRLADAIDHQRLPAARLSS